MNGEFNLTDKGNLELCLVIKITKHSHNALELTQSHLIQRTIDDLELEEESKLHDTSTNVALTKDEDGKKVTRYCKHRSVIGTLRCL